jgi:hypothetical protein
MTNIIYAPTKSEVWPVFAGTQEGDIVILATSPGSNRMCRVGVAATARGDSKKTVGDFTWNNGGVGLQPGDATVWTDGTFRLGVTYGGVLKDDNDYRGYYVVVTDITNKVFTLMAIPPEDSILVGTVTVAGITPKDPTSITDSFQVGVTIYSDPQRGNIN